MAVEEAVVERPVEQVERELDVRRGRQLAAFDRPEEDRAGLGSAWLDEPLAVEVGEGRVGLRLGDQGGDDASVWSFADQADPGA